MIEPYCFESKTLTSENIQELKNNIDYKALHKTIGWEYVSGYFIKQNQTEYSLVHFMKKITKPVLVCGVSAGRSSGFLARYISLNKNYTEKYDIIYHFENTGEEVEESLIFLDQIEREFNIPILWLEAVINDAGIGTSFRRTTFNFAKRNGEPFDSMLEKYPLPNVSISNCTRELKLSVINSYMKHIGVRKYTTALGIRHDERHRISINAELNDIIYPIANDIRVDEPFVRVWWRGQSFDLNLDDF